MLQKYSGTVSSIKINFGGFVSLSTIDWRGKSVCTVFLRGCPLRCTYCQNESIQNGEDYRDVDEIIGMIKTSSPFISGVIFSGGEPTMQKEPLIALARVAKGLGLDVGIQTNGFFPDTLEALLSEGLVDQIAIDYKTRWEAYTGVIGGYCTVPKENYEKSVRKSIRICMRAADEGKLGEFEVVITVFYENEEYIRKISDEVGKTPLVLQQGEHKVTLIRNPASDMTNGEYIHKKRILQEKHPPLTLDKMKNIADELGRKVRIRTKEIGEIPYENRRNRRPAGKRKR